MKLFLYVFLLLIIIGSCNYATEQKQGEYAIIQAYNTDEMVQISTHLEIYIYFEGDSVLNYSEFAKDKIHNLIDALNYLESKGYRLQTAETIPLLNGDVFITQYVCRKDK